MESSSFEFPTLTFLQLICECTWSMCCQDYVTTSLFPKESIPTYAFFRYNNRNDLFITLNTVHWTLIRVLSWSRYINRFVLLIRWNLRVDWCAMEPWPNKSSSKLIFITEHPLVRTWWRHKFSCIVIYTDFQCVAIFLWSFQVLPPTSPISWRFRHTYVNVLVR
jgi:hypothetical protein